MLKQMQHVCLSIHKKLNLANNLYYRKLIIFKNQLVLRQPDAIDCNCYNTTKFFLNTYAIALFPFISNAWCHNGLF